MCYGALGMQALSGIRDVSTLTSNNSATSASIKILKCAFFFAATELTVCPILSFVEEFCGALVLWRCATAPCYGACYGSCAPWTSETPRNLAELAKQMQLVHNALQRQSQSSTAPIYKVVKGVAQENIELRAANECLQRKKRPRQTHLRNGDVLQV
jgi:hypothetical protein